MGRGLAKASTLAAGLADKLIASIALAAAPALAQEEDTQFWIYAIASTDLDAATQLTVDATARWRQERLGDEQQTARLTILHEVEDGIRIGGGGGVFETEGGATERRLHEELSLRSGRFSARSRIEQRFFDRANRIELRARQLIRYTHPLSGSLSLSVDGEYLGLVQTRERDSDGARSQWRARLILSAPINNRVTLGAGYLVIYTPQDGRTDRLSHAPQLYLTSRF